MPNDITAVFDPVWASDATDIIVTLGTPLTDGSARACAEIVNTSDFPFAKIWLRLRSGSVAPTAGRSYNIHYLNQSEDANQIGVDGWGGSDAAITILNARRIGTVILTADTATDFPLEIDTRALGIVLGHNWGIAILNNSGQSMDSTESNHLKMFRYYRSQVQ